MTFIVYTKSNCPYCDKAKKLLEKEQMIVINCDVMLNEDRDAFINEMKHKTGWKRITFPMIFIDSEFLGGYDELTSHIIFFDYETEF